MRPRSGLSFSKFPQLFVLLAIASLTTTAAHAARLGHPQYSAAGATASQKQWNLLCDPPAAVSGSTSTLYDPSIAALNTITAWPGFELDEVDVIINGEGSFDQQFFLPPGTTQFVIVPAGAAFVQTVGTVYYASLEGSEVGAVQVFWSPFQTVTPAASVTTQKPLDRHSDVNTHIITFDNVSGKTKQVATFTNYANGNTNFPNYFPTPDSYSGPGFTYTADQILPATVRIKLKHDGDDDHEDNSKDDRKGH